ncbi:MAG: DUF5666 domain-containing protein [Fimbriimonadales bacterium]|nr:DUF5666 domain-containing protein [Fimbriimonadales bacterium]
MKLLIGLLLCAAWILVGCGGSGEGGSVASNGTVAVFARGAEDTHDHVIVSLHRIDLMAGSNATVVFDDPSGRTLDLRALASSDGPRFQLLALADVARGQYDAVVLSLGKKVAAIAKDSPEATEKAIDDSLDAEKGLVKLRVPLEGGLQVGAGRSDLVLHFDLPAWSSNQDKLLPAVKVDRSREVANRERHVEQAFAGAVESVSGNAPDTSFSLRMKAGSWKVRCGASTLIANADGSPAPLLKPGARVRVVGRFDPQGGQVLASSVVLGETAASTLEGRPGRFDAATGVFQLAWSAVLGAVPASREVEVTVGAGTVVRGLDGAVLQGSERTEALAAAEKLRASGVFDGRKMAATAIEVLGGEAVRQVSVEGGAKGKASSLELRLEAWDGFAGRPEDRVQVRLAEDCRFFDPAGNPISRAQFEEAWQSGQTRLRVVGRWSGGALLGSQARLLPASVQAGTAAKEERSEPAPRR